MDAVYKVCDKNLWAILACAAVGASARHEAITAEVKPSTEEMSVLFMVYF